MKTLCEITWTTYKFVVQKKGIKIFQRLQIKMCLSPLSKQHFILNLFYFNSYNTFKGNFTSFFKFFFFLLNFLHTRAWKTSDVIPNGNETDLHPKNEVFIPYASLLLNLWKPKSESAFLLITDVLLLAALSQCLWLCPGFSVYLGAQLIQLVLASLYLQHHFAALWPTVMILPWCFTPTVQLWTCFPPKYQRNERNSCSSTAQTEWSQQPLALKERYNVMSWKFYQKPK